MNMTIASHEHDLPLRHMAREHAMPGWVRLAFAREPDWFIAQTVLGHSIQTMVALDASDHVVGCGVRAIRNVFVNGQSTDIGYLCGLRSLPPARRALGLGHAFRFFRRLHDADRKVPMYLSTIVEANTAAMQLLTSGRPPLPSYIDQGRFITSAVLLGRRVSHKIPRALRIVTGGDLPREALEVYLRQEGAARQFFPSLGPGGFTEPQWRGLDPSAFRVALRDGMIVGTIAAWDQSAFRQTLVTGYAPAIRCVRPVLNAGLRMAGYPMLPQPGDALRIFHAALICIRHDDPAVFSALLQRLRADHGGVSAFDYFVVGLHERNPLLEPLRRIHAYSYTSRLFGVCWDDGRAFCAALDPHRVPHLETATL